MAMRPPSLRAVVAFEAAARHGGFRAAARELNLTDSAVGHAVRGLEARLGLRLFRREAGGLQLTAEGRALSGRVSMGLSLLDEAFETRPTRRAAPLVVSVTPAFAARFLSARLARFWQARPAVQLDLRCTAELCDLGRSDVDLAVRYGLGRWAGVRTEPLATTPLVAVASPDYRGGALPVTLRQLAGCDLLEEPHTSWRPVWPDGDAPSDCVSRLRLDDVSAALCAACAGLGVALVPWILAADDLAAGRLRQVASLALPSPYGFWLAWSNSSEKQQLIADFAGWLGAEVQAACDAPLQAVA